MAREYIAFGLAVFAAFCFVLLIVGFYLRAQGRGRQFRVLGAKLVLALGMGGLVAFLLGKRLRLDLGLQNLANLTPLDGILLGMLVASLAYALYSIGKALNPS